MGISEISRTILVFARYIRRFIGKNKDIKKYYVLEREENKRTLKKYIRKSI